MTVDKLEQLARLNEKATQGPLEFVNTELGVSYKEAYGLLLPNGHPSGISAERFIDAEFIAALVNWYRSGGAELARDGLRYRHMRSSAEFQDRNGPGLYWYLPRWDRKLPLGERLDAAIDEARHAARQVGGGERG